MMHIQLRNSHLMMAVLLFPILLFSQDAELDWSWKSDSTKNVTTVTGAQVLPGLPSNPFEKKEAEVFSGIPTKPKSHVTDLTSTLTASEHDFLKNQLKSLADRTSTQIFVLIANKIPESSNLEDAATRIFDAWKPGREFEDNGVLLVVFLGDRRFRIETGYGLEGVLTDALAGEILDYIIAPRFREGDFYGGLLEGVNAISGTVEGEYQIPVQHKQPEPSLADFIPLIIFLIFIFMILRARRNSSETYSKRGYRQSPWGGPIIWTGGSRNSGRGGGFGGFGGGGGGGFGGGFGGMSGGGGASGGW
ncbi:MAG: TPM domain-containing protein [Calditrichia bacterium]